MPLLPFVSRAHMFQIIIKKSSREFRWAAAVGKFCLFSIFFSSRSNAHSTKRKIRKTRKCDDEVEQAAETMATVKFLITRHNDEISMSWTRNFCLQNRTKNLPRFDFKLIFWGTFSVFECGANTIIDDGSVNREKRVYAARGYLNGFLLSVILDYELQRFKYYTILLKRGVTGFYSGCFIEI